MGHDKLRKFAENETFSCLLQPEASSVLDKVEGSNSLILKEHPIKGHWNERMFAHRAAYSSGAWLWERGVHD